MSYSSFLIQILLVGLSDNSTVRNVERWLHKEDTIAGTIKTPSLHRQIHLYTRRHHLYVIPTTTNLNNHPQTVQPSLTTHQSPKNYTLKSHPNHPPPTQPTPLINHAHHPPNNPPPNPHNPHPPPRRPYPPPRRAPLSQRRPCPKRRNAQRTKYSRTAGAQESE